MKIKRFFDNVFPCSILFTVYFLMFNNLICAQSLTQTIKGVVLDKDTNVPLAGATIQLTGTQPVIGTTADSDGNFSITEVPVGRYNIKFTFVGYDPVIIKEVLVSSSKETVLQAFLKEAAVSLNQVEVKAYSNKEQPVNSMAMISARQLTMEEASRYAGGIDDPARLASAFAGVAGNLSSNAIVIRGNAPKGLLWRMEGIEIPNPSHFANVTTFGGGGITVLSSQMLTSSDFYTGAFPAEYGNALSGVFDMRMRVGNEDKREYTIKAGIIGIDLASEGPFIKGRKASYLFNYRYSTLALISPLLPANAQGLRYQDFAFKCNFPLNKAGVLTFWGMLSADRTGSDVLSDTSAWTYYQDMESDLNINRMGAAGLQHKIILTRQTYLHTSIALTGNRISWKRQRMNNDLQLYNKDELLQSDYKITTSILLNHKFGSAHTNRTGIIINSLHYNILTQSAITENDPLIIYADDNGSSHTIQLFSQSRIDLTKNLTANIGIHSMIFTLKNQWDLEPRIGLNWKFGKKHSLSLAYGKHSRLEPLSLYLASQYLPSGIVYPNKELSLTKADHFVLGYELSISDNTRFRVEPFYQRLYDVPVIKGSPFSAINLEVDWFFNDSLVSKGTGYNIGIDLTLERFLESGYYYLFTLSLFDSKYKGGDGILYNSRFNKNIVANFLFGKEWKTGKYGDNSIGLNWKFSYLGGDRITPVDQAATAAAKDVVYDESRAFTEHKPSTWYLDLTASWKINKPGHTSVWSVQFVNLLFQKEFFGYRYNIRTNKADPQREVIFIPNISYRIDF